MKPPNCVAKEIFVIKENRPVQNTTKKIILILDVEYQKINFKSVIMSLNHLKVKHKDSLLDFLQKVEEIIYTP